MITTIRENEYVVNKVVGDITIGDLVECAQNNTEIWLSDPVLWDLSKARMKSDNSDYAAVSAVVSNIHEMAEKRKGKRTAFFAPEPFSFGMLRMAITIVEYSESRLVASVFKNIDAAMAWLLNPVEDDNNQETD
jgi:hypothetical protein